MNTTTSHNLWVFSIVHDFNDEQDLFISKIERRTDARRLLYGKAIINDTHLTKGIIQFDSNVTKEYVKKTFESSDVFPVTNWSLYLGSDKHFKVREIIWKVKTNPLRPASTPMKREPIEPVGLKGLDFLPDDICPNCGV